MYHALSTDKHRPNGFGLKKKDQQRQDQKPESNRTPIEYEDADCPSSDAVERKYVPPWSIQSATPFFFPNLALDGRVAYLTL